MKVLLVLLMLIATSSFATQYTADGRHFGLTTCWVKDDVRTINNLGCKFYKLNKDGSDRVVLWADYPVYQDPGLKDKDVQVYDVKFAQNSAGAHAVVYFTYSNAKAEY